MNQREARQLARESIARLSSLSRPSVPRMRPIRRELSRRLGLESPTTVITVAQGLIDGGHRWVGYELIHANRGALESLAAADVEALGEGMSSWDHVDTFGGYIAGPAWLRGQISDRAIAGWTRSLDRWWRRSALLVATVSLNKKSAGGVRDSARTLDICRSLADDHDDMVEKALSWALRTLVVWDAKAVRGFLDEHAEVLGARVIREVNNKLRTGVKNPGKRRRT